VDCSCYLSFVLHYFSFFLGTAFRSHRSLPSPSLRSSTTSPQKWFKMRIFNSMLSVVSFKHSTFNAMIRTYLRKMKDRRIDGKRYLARNDNEIFVARINNFFCIWLINLFFLHLSMQRLLLLLQQLGPCHHPCEILV